MARKALFNGWKSVTSPVNISGWHLGRFCRAKVATSLLFTVVRSSTGVDTKGFVLRRQKRGVFPVTLFPGGDFSKLAAFVLGKRSSFAR